MRLLLLVLLCMILNSNALYAEPVKLDQAVSEALANNPGLLRLETLHQGISTGRLAGLLPENPELFAEIEEIPDGSGIGGYGERRIGITQEFDFPLSYYHRARLNTLTGREAAFTSEHERLRVIADVKSVFFRVLMLEGQIELQDEIVRIARNLQENALTRVEAGEATRYEPLRVSVEVGEAESRLLVQHNELRFNLYLLKQLMGRDKADSVWVEGELDISTVAFPVDSLKQVAIDRHPALREALARVEQRRVEKQIAAAASLPGISLSYFNQKFRDGDRTSAWGGEVALTVPIWDIAGAGSRMVSAEYALQAAGWELESLKREILTEVERAAKDLAIARDQVEKYQAGLLSEVSEMVRIAERSYEEGEVGYLEVTETLRTMQRARSGYLEALYAYQAAFAELEAAAGVPLSGHIAQ